MREIKKTATEIMIEHSKDIELLKAGFLYRIFGTLAVKETPEGFTLNVNG